MNHIWIWHKSNSGLGTWFYLLLLNREQEVLPHPPNSPAANVDNKKKHVLEKCMGFRNKQNFSMRSNTGNQCQLTPGQLHRDRERNYWTDMRYILNSYFSVFLSDPNKINRPQQNQSYKQVIKPTTHTTTRPPFHLLLLNNERCDGWLGEVRFKSNLHPQFYDGYNGTGP